MIGAGICGFSTLALAGAPAPMGWYLEGNLGWSQINNVSYAPNTNISSNGFGWNLNAGYKFMPYFATEIGYTSYQNGTINFNGTKVGKVVPYSYDLAAKAIIPIQDTGGEVFAKLGAARARSKVTASNAALLAANGETLNTGNFTSTDFYFGVGGDYFFMPNAAVNVQWNRADGNKKTGNLDLLSIGLTYLFD